MSDYQPRPEHKFTFGLWSVGNPGRDSFGESTRTRLEPPYIVSTYAVKESAELDANPHDNDLAPLAAGVAERQGFAWEFEQALDGSGLERFGRLPIDLHLGAR